MSKLNEKDTELYIHEKYIINLSAEENIFTDDVMKKIHHLSNGITDRIDFLCLQYLSDPIGVKQNSKIYQDFVQSEDYASLNRLGLWGACR